MPYAIGYAEHAPADAQALREDHVAIRKALEALAIEVELHCVRAHSINDLVNSLRVHAAREDAGMYPWAQTHLPATPRKQLMLRVGRSLRSLAQFRRRHVDGLGAASQRHTGYSR